MLALAALVLGTAATLAGDPRADRGLPPDVPTIDAVSLAERIRAREEGLRLLDVQDPAETAPYSIPTAVHVTVDTVARIAKGGILVVYAEEADRAARVAAVLRGTGHDAVVLDGGAAAWIARVLEPKLYLDATPADTQEYRRASSVSRYFGGQPRASIERPPAPAAGTAAETTRNAAARVRRRGCAVR